ncbi:toll/interleukin-1 receptor domain-containing protein [Methylorubrum extorquens]|uniref:toll/interleukin-1 receptor domain-containing protein n=1 Tax=Methylorubrum extorquens TaxID=408 RepID=UPI000158EFCF|nr:toll/interleukin-1 receptor domain-containing protein [Methylorubrum extorquens]ABY30319.1 TIR protein [Methylorubrum extorquens PA1]KQP89255.1 molecular chaperone Tir [Methylobacterium sp. Leaf119]WIU41610.1 toll/interleukin-1 receptor domain-containing protein [Methylorubrum extorquens]
MRARARTHTEKPGPTSKTAAKAKPGPRSPARPAVPRPKPEKPEVRIFVSYSHRDADARQRLETHLAPLKREGVTTWFDGDMNAGDKLDTGIARALRNAHVFVGLLSPDYLASNYCWKIEYKRAMGRRANGTMRVVAVVLRPCDWKSTTAAGFKLLPEDGKEVTRWRSADDAFLNVAQGIRRVVADVRKTMAAAPPKPAPRKPAASKAAAQPPTKPGPKPRQKPGPKPNPGRAGAGAVARKRKPPAKGRKP